MNQSQMQTQPVYTNEHTMDRKQIRLRRTTRIRPSIVALFAVPVFMVLFFHEDLAPSRKERKAIQKGHAMLCWYAAMLRAVLLQPNRWRQRAQEGLQALQP